ncbi:hypothetical protein LIER_40511 [Lithospermum erythrorhizon]|uniref:Uncharacterized protein n=1 Tax=Lithospermum erythrorhizon TaxID=34254 RepID=A0AAV3QY77_LITER
MAPYEALYSRKCRSPVYWDEVGEKSVMAPDDLKDIEERIPMIREWIQTTQSRQKSYADYLYDPDHVIDYAPLDLREDVTYGEISVNIIDQKDKVLRHQSIRYVKVRWRNHIEREAM